MQNDSNKKFKNWFSGNFLDQIKKFSKTKKHREPKRQWMVEIKEFEEKLVVNSGFYPTEDRKNKMRKRKQFKHWKIGKRVSKLSNKNAQLLKGKFQPMENFYWRWQRNIRTIIIFLHMFQFSNG